MTIYKILKEKVWEKFQKNCPYKKYTDLTNVGGTFCYTCNHPNETLKSMCRYPLCIRKKELLKNPNNYDKITQNDLIQIQIEQTIINYIEEIYENNYNQFMATPKGIKKELVDETNKLHLTLEEIKEICDKLIKSKQLTTKTIIHNNKKYEIFCTIEYKQEFERKKAQKKSNIKEIKNEINRIEIEIKSLIDCFKNRKFKFDNPEHYQYINRIDIDKLYKRAKTLFKGIEDFKNWFNYWKEKDWCD